MRIDEINEQEMWEEKIDFRNGICQSSQIEWSQKKRSPRYDYEGLVQSARFV